MKANIKKWLLLGEKIGVWFFICLLLIGCVLYGFYQNRKIDELESESEARDEEIAELRAKINDVEAEMPSEFNISMIESDILNLQRRVDEGEGRIGDLETKATNLDREVASLDSEVGSSFHAPYGTLWGGITKLDSRVDSIEWSLMGYFIA